MPIFTHEYELQLLIPSRSPGPLNTKQRWPRKRSMLRLPKPRWRCWWPRKRKRILATLKRLAEQVQTMEMLSWLESKTVRLLWKKLRCRPLTTPRGKLFLE